MKESEALHIVNESQASAPACTLAAADARERSASLAELARDALKGCERRDLVLELRYAPWARDRVREMVRKEQECCAFLSFELREDARDIHVTVTAPESARAAAEDLFGQFTSKGEGENLRFRAAPAAAMTSATAAVGCGVCCVLPFALPAATLAGAGGIIGWFAGAQLWLTAVAVLAVGGAWGWVGLETRRARARAAPATVYWLLGATAMLALAILWPWIEPHVVAALRA